MRPLIAILIILAFPWFFNPTDKQAVQLTDFCVPEVAYCLQYDAAIFLVPESDEEQFGGELRSKIIDLEGRFTAHTEAVQLDFEDYYLATMRDLEQQYPKGLEQLNSLISDDYYYVSVETPEGLRFFQAWKKDRRLVQLELSADLGMAQDTWQDITQSFAISWK